MDFMKFWEAMKALEEGKNVRRKHFNMNFHGFLGMVKLLEDCCEDEIKSCLNAEWELYEEPVKTYKIWELIPELKKGKKIGRLRWKNPDAVLHIEKAAAGWCPLFINKEGYPNGLNLEDIEADDWVIRD